MIVQVITLCDYLSRALQQSIILARAFAYLSLKVRLLSLSSQILSSVREAIQKLGIELIEISPDQIPKADINIVVGLWDHYSAETVVRLAHCSGRLILVPTHYWFDNLLSDFKGCAEALWYLSWDQAVHTRSYWSLANRVEVVRCAVDINRFQPLGRVPTGHPWVLCRHSRDSPEKFAQDATFILNCLSNTHDVIFSMLGALETIGRSDDNRIHTFSQEALDPAIFLPQGDVWVYSHASYWRETACIAMLEAMACGLPVVVRSTGGMREYLVHGRTGFACVDTDEFVHFISLLLDQPALRQSMALAARGFVQQYHSLGSLTHCIQNLL